MCVYVPPSLLNRQTNPDNILLAAPSGPQAEYKLPGHPRFRPHVAIPFLKGLGNFTGRGPFSQGGDLAFTC